MAYNIMKGTVEFSSGTGSLEGTVDLSSDQSVAGGKTFVQRITASAITLGGTPLVVPAITAISNDGANRVFTSDNDGTVTAQTNVTITNNSLTASFFSGSGVGLTSLQADQVTGQLSASQVHIGVGLKAVGKTLAVSASDGLSVSATGVTLDLMASHGLVFSGSSRELAINPSNAAAITDDGQSLADADSFIVYDASRVQTRRATAENVYTYINSKISTPAITSYTNASNNRVLTSVSSNTVNGEANLTFDGSTLVLQGLGQVTGSLEITGSGTNLLKLHKGPADTREIEIFSNGSRQSAITLNAAEQLFIENESTKDIILRTNNQNTLRVFGQNQRVGIAKEGVSANAELDVDGAAIISGSFTVSGASTFGTIATHVTQFVGHVSASAGMHISGTMPKLAIGSNTSTTNNSGMLTVRPDDTNNRVLMMLQRTEASDNRIVLAATGSGQVIVGGAHLDGVLNVSGSNIEKLISLKSDSENPAFYVSGSGDAALSGRLALKSDTTTDPTTLTNHAHIYAKDVATSAEVFVRDEAGNVTQISPHTPEGEWQYFSRNTRTGKVVRVNMERMIRKLEEFTGESFMEEWYEDPTD